ncbi:MAG TPA: amidohydrolase [Verrucomicrobiales bacterium]|nr:amidohydrolase [Verrucomicrobiales bacterium]
MHPTDACSRRRFLQIAAGGIPAAVMAATGCAGPSTNAHDGAIDTHTHFYDPTRPQGVPWPPANDPILYRTVLPGECEALARPLGIGGTIVVEASPWELDNDWVLDLARKSRFILGLVGHLKPGRPGFREGLERLARNPLFRGIRTGGWEVDIEPGRNAYLEDLKRIADRGLSLDVLIGPERLPDIARLAERFPSMTIIIDHVANVRVDGALPPAAWLTGMRACGARPNIYCKGSGLVEGTGRSDGQAPADAAPYQPVLDHVWDCFGEERLLFGSNWPVSARFAPYPVVHGIVKRYVESRGPRATRRFFRENALRAYRPPTG